MPRSRGAYAALHAATRAAAQRPPVVPTSLQVESWRLLWEEHAADPDARAERAAWERAREEALPALRDLIARFVEGEVALAPFRATLDARTKSDWRALALRGPAGAMLLNQLVRRAGDDPARADALHAALRIALAAPRDAAAADTRLRALLRAITPLAPLASRTSQVQPARVVAFVAACWHAQDAERWPAYQPSARDALAAEEGLFAPTGDAVADYLAFRLAFLALAASVGVTVPQLEHLCRWHRLRRDEGMRDDALDALDDAPDDPALAPAARSARRARPAVRAPRVAERAAAYVADAASIAPNAVRPVSPSPAGPSPATPSPATSPPPYPSHTQVQWQLARLGRALGCRVWVAANDHARAWDGESLGSLSLPRLPRLALGDESERLVQLIDVVWLAGRHRVAAAFEIEHTTSVHSGLLRMADLAALAPNLSFPLYVVAPRARLGKVRRELARPSLQALGLHRRCGFFAAESLLESADAIARWGGGAEAIERLAEHVGGGESGA